MSKVWLVTGSASGLGRSIAEAVLASGDRLVATARDPRRLEDLVKKYGDQVRAAALDVIDEGAAYAAVRVAVDAFGRLDVVVNNAGYGDIAPFEQVSCDSEAPQAGSAPGTPSAISNVARVWTGELGASTVATARKSARQRSSSTSQRT